MTTQHSYLTAEQHQRAVDVLSTFIPSVRHDIDAMAEDLAADFGIPASTLAVGLSEILRDGIAVLSNDLAGRAESEGASITSLAQVIELNQPTNYRRKMIHAHDFAEAYRTSRLAGTTVPVTVGEWTIEVGNQHN